VLDINPWYWLRLSSVTYFVVMFVSLAVFFKTLLPGLRWPLAAVLAIISVTASKPYWGSASHQIFMPWIQAIYSVSFGLYGLLLAAFIIFMEKHRLNVKSGIILCIIFFIFVGMHELHIVSAGFFLIFFVLLALRFEHSRRPFSAYHPFSRIKIRATLRLGYDSRNYIVTVIALFGLLGVNALIQLLAPSVALRQTYWPARMMVWEAFLAAFPQVFDLLGRVFSPEKPYLMLLFLLVFFIARAYPVREVLRGRNKHFLLIPTVMFLVTAHLGSMLSLIMIDTTAVTVRLQNYFVGYAFVALSCLAVYLANSLRLRWLPGKAAHLIGVGIFAVILVGLGNDALYRTAVEQAMGSGYEYSQGVAERVRLLSEGKDRTVYVPELVEPPSMVQPLVHKQDTEQYFQDKLAVAFGQRKVVFTPCGLSSDPYRCHYMANPGGAERER
jgi:flagellar biogenesis protein FliO